MGKTSLRLPDDMIEALDAEANEEGVTRSEYIRRTLARRSEYDDLRRENERLREQLRATNARQDDIDDLVAYVEGERELQRLERERRTASWFTRMKWGLFGRSGE